MQQIIAAYLFQHKTCPLPGLGTLCIQSSNAQSDFLNKNILAPVPAILFNSKETEADDLIDHIAAATNSTVYQAIENLGQFANQLKSTINSGKTVLLNGVGSFTNGNDGKIIFESIALPAAFLPPVHAERVIHPQAEHSILVGDKETTNTVMTEYFSEEPAPKNRWWIWAIIIGIIAIAVLAMYLTGNNILSRFGSAMPIQ